jgi:hypothetical protein
MGTVTLHLWFTTLGPARKAACGRAKGINKLTETAASSIEEAAVLCWPMKLDFWGAGDNRTKKAYA